MTRTQFITFFLILLSLGLMAERDELSSRSGMAQSKGSIQTESIYDSIEWDWIMALQAYLPALELKNFCWADERIRNYFRGTATVFCRNQADRQLGDWLPGSASGVVTVVALAI